MQYRKSCVRPIHLPSVCVTGSMTMRCCVPYRFVVTFVPAEAESEEEGLASTLESIAELPPCNKDTLAFVILHLQK